MQNNKANSNFINKYLITVNDIMNMYLSNYILNALHYTIGHKMVVVAAGKVYHEVLCAFWKVTDRQTGRATIAGKGRHYSLWTEDGVVLNHATILKDTSSALKDQIFI